VLWPSLLGDTYEAGLCRDADRMAVLTSIASGLVEQIETSVDWFLT